MSKIILIIFSILLFESTNGQNLVNNSSFEQYSTCPNYVSQISFATGWDRPTNGTSDYFNGCLGVPFSMNVPDNQFGFQAASSGNGYAGFYAFYSVNAFTIVPSNKREYVTSVLNQPLQVGETYSIEFYVSLSEASKYGVNDLGLLFSMNQPYRNDDSTINLIPQITNLSLSPLIDKINWTKISGCFIADSNYTFITIGNFNNGINTISTFINSTTSNLHYSYYYLDDILIKKLPKPIISSKPKFCDSGIINVTNYNQSSQFLWSNGETISSIIVDSSNYYSVAINNNGCWVYSDTTKIMVYDSPYFDLGNDMIFDFCQNQTFDLYPTNYMESSSSYLWSTGDDNSIISIENAGEYSLTITDTNNCFFFDQIDIKDICDGTLFVPNSFTPNGDGINDFFQIYGNNIELISLSIFNRWGEKIFNTSSIDESWNGGLHLDGIYTWSINFNIQLSGINREVFKIGHIALIR